MKSIVPMTVQRVERNADGMTVMVELVGIGPYAGFRYEYPELVKDAPIPGQTVSVVLEVKL